MHRKRCSKCLHKMKKTKPHTCPTNSKGKIIIANLTKGGN